MGIFPKRGTDAVLVGILETPLGIFAGVLQSQLELIQMPYVNETGRVGRVPMKRLYLQLVLHNLADNIHVDMNALLEGSREFIVIANMDISSVDECCPCYYGTTKNADDMENLRHLESTVMWSLSRGLDSLPSKVLVGWKNKVLIPIFGQARMAISRKHSNVRTTESQ